MADNGRSGRIPALGFGEIHLWRIALGADEAARQGHLRCLSADERVRAERFVFPQHRDRFVVARGALRRILAAYLDRAPEELRFLYGRRGKPALAAPIEFNLSHSGDWALLAVAADFAVGVDIERIRPEVVTPELMTEVFAPAEQAAVAATPADRRAEAFFKCWTSKEAYIKGLGDGLGIPLRSFEVCVDPARPVQLLRPYEGAAAQDAWSLHDVASPPAGYAATLAAAGPQRIAVVEIAAPG